MNIAKLLTASLVAVWLILPVFAQEQQSKPRERGMKGAALHEQMQADMKAMDEKLDKLVLDMNAAATPDAKLDALVAVVNEMVSQHKRIHEKMSQRWMEHHHEPGAGPKAGEKRM